MKTKKSVALIFIIVLAVFLSGCLNYKPYQNPAEEDQDLLSEIAEIEKELAETGASPDQPAEVPEEITLPLEEEPDYSNLKKIEVKENELVNLQLKVSDPDKDNIKYSFSLPLNEQGKWKTNYGDAGEYVVTITATDGVHTTNKDILLVVKKVNVPPFIKELKNILIKEGETVSLDPQVIDPNGDSVTVTVSEPLSSGTWATDHTSAGEYEVVVTASDGELESKANFLLKVADVNVLPEIVGLGDITVKEGETVEIKPTITDLDNDKITLTISDPVGNDGVWETTYTSHGVYPVTITVSDGKDLVTKNIKLTVEDVNMPPEIIDITLG